MSVRSIAGFLSRIPLFEGCDPAHLQMLAFASQRTHYETGATIIEAGQNSAFACLILTGESDVFSGAPNVGVAFARAKPGTLLGEISMIAGSAYSISAVAAQPVSAARIGRDVFMRVAGEFPEFGAHVHKMLAARLDGSIGELARLHDIFAKAPSFPRG